LGFIGGREHLLCGLSPIERRANRDRDERRREDLIFSLPLQALPFFQRDGGRGGESSFSRREAVVSYLLAWNINMGELKSLIPV